MSKEQLAALRQMGLSAAIASMDVVQGAYGAAWLNLTRALESLVVITDEDKAAHEEIRETLQRIQTDLSKVRGFFRRALG